IIYTQVFRCVTFLFALICGIQMFRKEEQNYIYMLVLALIGIIIFLMLWETNKKHNICYIPIALILMEQGIEYSSRSWEYLCRKDFKGRLIKNMQRIELSFIVISILMICCSVVIMINDFPYYTKNLREYRNYTFMK